VCMCLLCVVGIVVAALAFLVPLFVAFKVDGTVKWNWGVVFIPLWIVNIVPLIYSASLICLIESKLKAFSTLLQYFCFLVFEILLCIQLQDPRWKWSVVFIPLYMEEGINILKKLFAIAPAKYRELVETESAGFLFGCGYFGFILDNFVIALLRVWFLIFIVVKLQSQTSWSWWIVSIPVFVAMAWKLFKRIADDTKLTKAAPDEGERSRRKTFATGMSVVYGIMIAFGLVLLILVVLRLDGSNFSTAVAFIPIFIVLGLVLCCCCCCIPIMYCCAPRGENFDAEEGNGVTEQSPLTSTTSEASTVTQPNATVTQPSATVSTSSVDSPD